MIGKLFAGTLAKVSTGIVAVLLAALLWCWIGWSNADARTEEAQRRLALSEAQHAVTRQSLATLEQEMAELVHAGELRADRIPSEPDTVADQLTGNAAADLPIVAASALLLRAWGWEMHAALVSCAE